MSSNSSDQTDRNKFRRMIEKLMFCHKKQPNIYTDRDHNCSDEDQNFNDVFRENLRREKILIERKNLKFTKSIGSDDHWKIYEGIYYRIGERPISCAIKCLNSESKFYSKLNEKI